MKIAIIGDVVGSIGRNLIRDNLANIKKEYQIDLVIANTENATHGFGLIPRHFHELKSYGVDIFTGGNHSFDKKEIMSLMNTENILRPINYPDTVAGNSTSIIDDTAIINVMGVFGLPSTPFNPFLRLEEEITSLKNNKIQNIIIDVHAEATSEKRAVYQMFKDEVNIIYGTHTHIGTDDLEIYNNRCSYVSDIGMTGSLDGIIGMDQANPIKRFKEGVSNALDVVKESNNNIFQFLVIDLEDSLIKSAQKIKLYTKDNQKIISTAVNL